jgi:class 3 adenylate cyclase
MPPPSNQHPVLDCLLSLMSFETHWAYYLQSDGNLYAPECRQYARQWAVGAQELLAADEALRQRVAQEMVPETTFGELLNRVREWSEGEAIYPFESSPRSRFMMFVITAPLKDGLMKKLGTAVATGADYTFDEINFQRRQVLWSGHLSRRLMQLSPEDVAGFLSQSDSIAVIGDIRRSQDLMTYGPDAEFFGRNMLQFLTTTRNLLAERHGIFDKFTGDGFLAYFNSGLCRKAGRDPLACFMDFARALAEFSAGHFKRWGMHLRKIPGEGIGLALGADIGRVIFRHEESMLFAVGEAIVWAERMCNGAAAGDLMANNMLASQLSEQLGLSFEKVAGRTKAGESYLGFRLRF